MLKILFSVFQFLEKIQNSFFISDAFIWYHFPSRFCIKDSFYGHGLFEHEIETNGFGDVLKSITPKMKRIWNGEKWRLS